MHSWNTPPYYHNVSPGPYYNPENYSPYFQEPQLPGSPHIPRSPSQSPMEITVPQRQYSANIQRNHIRTIPAVEFIANGVKGIRLADVRSRAIVGLRGADDRPLEGFGTKVTYRIEWPGYESFNRQKHALRATREKQSVSRMKMAVHVAEVVNDFIKENATAPTTDPTWRIGAGFIDFGDLYLLEIHQVAKASLQPVIAYRPSHRMLESPELHYSPIYPMHPPYAGSSSVHWEQ